MVGWLVVDGREEGWLDEWMDENGLLDGCESSVLGRLVRGEGLAATCTLRQSTHCLHLKFKLYFVYISFYE